jgi:hypothetical protein
VITDLVAGQIAFLMDSVVSAQPHIGDGKVRPLAVSGASRSPSLPERAHLRRGRHHRHGLQQLVRRLRARRAPPPEIVQRLNRELNAIAARARRGASAWSAPAPSPAGGTPSSSSRPTGTSARAGSR